MKKNVIVLFHYIIVLIWLFSTAIPLHADDIDILNQKVRLSKNKGTVYQLLQQLSESNGYSFIYDSQIINNDKTVKIPKQEYTLQEAVYAITNNKQLKIKIVGNHILLYVQEKQPVRNQSSDQSPENTYFTFSGNLKDRITNEPVAYGAIAVNNSTIGTVANQDGDFKLVLPDSLLNSTIKISQLGYQSQEVDASLLEEQNVVFYLDPKIIPLQEVVVRIVDPMQELRTMLLKRVQNYSVTPVNMTTFYREGVNYKNKNLNITEAVLGLYKSGVGHNVDNDQVKLLKMRRIVDKQEIDTFLPKMKSGINACLLLDIVKGELPAFLNLGKDNIYTYIHTDITTIDNRRVNVISFEPAYEDYLPYKGELYIDTENQALQQARFEIHPDYVGKVAETIILKKNKTYDINPQQVKYTVSYKVFDGIYYISHVRGDLYFKVRKKNRLFSSNLHMWFEMVNCETETTNVKSFTKDERISTNAIFAETKFDYDRDFWGNFNTIMLEDDLKESILRILKKNSKPDN